MNAYRTYTGSTLAAKAYLRAFGALGRPAEWVQCVSSRTAQDWDRFGTVVQGTTLFRADLNLVLNALYAFPRKLARFAARPVFLTDPILLGAAERLPRSVVLVHDLREFGPHRRSWAAEQVYRRLFRHLDRAHRIVCVSNATRDRLVELARPSPPIDVVHHCAEVRGDPSRHLAASLRRRSEGAELQVLYLAADRPYKNLELYCRLARSFAAGDGPRIRFRLVSHLRPATRRLVERLAAPNLEVVPEVGDLAALYDATDVLVHPSREEGYGLPLIEAMQFGIPVLAADIPAVRETLAGSGTLLPPDDLDAWRAALVSVSDPGRLEVAARRSAQAAAEYTAERFQERVAGLLPAWFD